MKIERAGDDIARCFALERVLFEGGSEQAFAGEVTGLISAGAFVAFGLPQVGEAGGLPQVGEVGGSSQAGEVGGIPPYEGMLPVRRMSLGERDWWELNQQGTILHGQRSGETLRLGDPIAVLVKRVDAPQGRVDLARAP